MIRPLFGQFGLSFPAVLEQPFNVSSVIHPGDVLPATLNLSQVSMAGKKFSISTFRLSQYMVTTIAVFWNNGVAHSLKSTPLDIGKSKYLLFGV